MNYELQNIGNMDETPVWFDIPAVRTIDSRGASTILIKTTGHENLRFIVVLACLADGTKLNPMVIFKRKTLPKAKFPSGVVVHVHPNGWMDEDGVLLKIEKVWRSRPGGFGRVNSMLVWDSFSAHLVDQAKQHLKENNTSTAVIPGGLTSVIQPLDVSLNKPFKDRLRSKWPLGWSRGKKSFTKGGNVKAASFPTVCQWVKEAWSEIASEIVVRSFKKCGISNAMDSTKDDMLWEDDLTAEDENAENGEAEEPNPYDDMLSAEDFNRLFGESDDEDFQGF